MIAALLSPGIDVFIGQVLVGGIGLFILWRRWREARRLQKAGQAADAASEAEGTEAVADA